MVRTANALTGAATGMPRYSAVVTVRLKTGVLDPEAETTSAALSRLGFEHEALTHADRFEVTLDAASADAAETTATAMAEQLLANPTLHSYDVEVHPR
jgi:phosphoribosylformylglycinamidine synthase